MRGHFDEGHFDEGHFDEGTISQIIFTLSHLNKIRLHSCIPELI